MAIQGAPVTGTAVAEAGTFQMPAEANPAAVELERRPSIFAKRRDGFSASFELELVGRGSSSGSEGKATPRTGTSEGRSQTR